MKTYDQYIVKRRMKKKAICGWVNLPYGTILPAERDFIRKDGQPVCAITSQNGKDFFWGYDPANPAGEIARQKAAAELMAAAPPDSGDALARSDNPWNRYGELEQIPGGWRWAWRDAVADWPLGELQGLLTTIRGGWTAN